MIVVADTSPLLHLARIGRLDLIRGVVPQVVTPQAVWDELLHPGTRADVAADLSAASWIEVRPDPVAEDLGLDPGETAAILLAETLGADALLIDERRGADERVELLPGVIVPMSPQSTRHVYTVGVLSEPLIPPLLGRARVRVQMHRGVPHGSVGWPDRSRSGYQVPDSANRSAPSTPVSGRDRCRSWRSDLLFSSRSEPRRIPRSPPGGSL